MIYLLYGEDTYRSRRKLREIAQEYRKKTAGVLDFHKIDAEENDLSALKYAYESSSLFSKKKLIIVENVFSDSCDADLLMKSVIGLKDSKDVIIILWGNEPPPAAKIKSIGRCASKTQEFKNLSGSRLTSWTLEEAKNRGLKLFPARLAYLARFGNDLWALSNELDKLAADSELGLGGNKTFPEKKIFDLGDVFFTSKRAALHNLLQLIYQGEDEFGIFAYLANHSRVLLTVKTYAQERQPLPPTSGIHPFVAKKAAVTARDSSIKKLERWHEKFFEEDLKIKTGQTTPREALLNILLLP